LVNNETITDWELQFWAPKGIGTSAGAAGVEIMRYSVRLTQAAICDIRFHMLNNKNPELARYAEYEEVAFTYQKIEWTWVPTALSASDSFSPRSTPKARSAAKKSATRKA
jgi:type VI secretion system secreted protein Hcp